MKSRVGAVLYMKEMRKFVSIELIGVGAFPLPTLIPLYYDLITYHEGD